MKGKGGEKDFGGKNRMIKTNPSANLKQKFAWKEIKKIQSA